MRRMLTKEGGKQGGRLPNPELRSREVEFGRRPPDEADPGSPAKPDRMLRPFLQGRPRPGDSRTPATRQPTPHTGHPTPTAPHRARPTPPPPPRTTPPPQTTPHSAPHPAHTPPPTPPTPTKKQSLPTHHPAPLNPNRPHTAPTRHKRDSSDELPPRMAHHRKCPQRASSLRA